MVESLTYFELDGFDKDSEAPPVAEVDKAPDNPDLVKAG